MRLDPRPALYITEIARLREPLGLQQVPAYPVWRHFRGSMHHIANERPMLITKLDARLFGISRYGMDHGKLLELRLVEGLVSNGRQASAVFSATWGTFEQWVAVEDTKDLPGLDDSVVYVEELQAQMARIRARIEQWGMRLPEVLTELKL